MGTIISKDIRRISFDNSFEINSTLALEKSIENGNVLAVDTFENVENKTLIFHENSKYKIQDEEEQLYWSTRMEHLKNEHQIINEIMEIEYEKTIEDKSKLYDIPKVTNDRIEKIKPCYDWRSKTMQCYEDNPRQPLICAPVVQAFKQCVASCRLDA